MRFIFILLFWSGTLQAQTITYDSVISIKNQGMMARPQFDTYIAKDGTVYKVGDKIKIGRPSTGKNFNYITIGDGVMMAPTDLPSSYAGTEIEIKKIYVFGTKKTGVRAYFWSKTMGIVGGNYSISVENAIDAGEIVSTGMTSDEALYELKKLKDKLDLGLITQEEYDKKKAELAKIIK